MSDHSSSSSSDAEGEESKLRISLVLAPSAARNRDDDGPSLEVPPEPIAVPSSIRKAGLSAVVNHLLDRRVDDGGGLAGSDDDSDDDEKLPAVPFDFLLNDRLLRLPLESAVRKEGLSTERALELIYFPARLPPKRRGESENLPDWITALACRGGEGDGTTVFAGGADGVVRCFSPQTDGLRAGSSISAHSGKIQCLSVGETDGGTVVATGSMDQTLVSHIYDENGDNEGTLKLHAAYSGGHANSIGSVALRRSGDKTLMASGDWDGGLAVWTVPSATISDENGAAEQAPKKRRGGGAGVASKPVAREVRPSKSVKAHASNISGLAWGHNNDRTLLTGSWDHGLKVYDVERMDCVLALNGSRVVTSLDRCSNGDVVAAAGPDCAVRLWDMRTDGAGNEVGTPKEGTGLDKTLRQR
ncbi:hypothetical protein ACHAWF_013487 [Thalassiosira exigua]